jgi:hypothetical protein
MSDTGDTTTSDSTLNDSSSSTADNPRVIQAILVTDADLLAQGAQISPDANAPSTQASTYTLIDNDAKTCRNISEDEFKASYVDDNIGTFNLADSSPFEETLDNELMNINYFDNTQTTIRFGLIDIDSALKAEQYAKSNGIIYPIDAAGALQLDKSIRQISSGRRTGY